MITLGSNFVIYNLPTCDVNFPVLRHYLGCQYDVINVKSFHETLGYLLQILVTPLYLAHCYNAFIEYSALNIIFLTFSYSRKRNNSNKVGITSFSLLMAKIFVLNVWSILSPFCCEIKQFWWKKFIKSIIDKIKFEKTFDKINISVLLFILTLPIKGRCDQFEFPSPPMVFAKMCLLEGIV